LYFVRFEPVISGLSSSIQPVAVQSSHRLDPASICRISMNLKRILRTSRAERVAQSPRPATIAGILCPVCSCLLGGFGNCAGCGHQTLLSPDDRISQLLDSGTFVEWDEDLHSLDPLSFGDSKSYKQRLSQAEAKTGRRESVVTGEGRLHGRRIVCIFFDFSFMGGTMGAATGEKIVRAFEGAERRQAPVLAVTATGGARVQEGTVALAQMTRVSAAVEHFHGRALPFVALLTEPSTGGVMVSLSSQADVILSEPGAHSSFAGRRIRQTDSAEENSADRLMLRGLIDAVVPRENQAAAIDRMLTILTRNNKTFPRGIEEKPALSSRNHDGWDSITKARSSERIRNEFFVKSLVEAFVPLRGDRSTGNDPAMITGIGTFEGRSVAILATKAGEQPGGVARPSASGYRQATRVALLAAKFGIPLISLIDTPGADASPESESQGLPHSIGRLFRTLIALPVPTVAVITSEGGSGGALGLGVADRLLMFESAVFSVIDPLAASRILFRDEEHAPQLSRSMALSATDALRLGVIDGIIPERFEQDEDPAAIVATLRIAIRDSIAESQRWLSGRLVSNRRKHIRALGAWAVSDEIKPAAAGREVRGWTRGLASRRPRAAQG
jgi:acyl-CoA carboxylase subunit beta